MISNEIAWRRVSGLYALPGIMPQCLALQSRADVGVTTLLTLLVLAAGGEGAVQAHAAAHIAQTSEAFQAAVLRPLRQARDGLKHWIGGPREGAAQALRQDLLERELAAERLEQEIVLDLLADSRASAPPGDPLADASRSIGRYLAALGARPDAELRQSLAHIVTAALEDYDGLHVARVLDRAFDESGV